MTNIYNLEPQAFGLITLKTTFGDVDLELFTKQCPKATRNFVQLCLDGYYEGTIFERVEKDFIAIGGCKLGEEIETQETFPDEFHSRLRFSRRGLLASANTDKDANGPKFFLTLGPAPELQNKHTIFGRVKGNSIYSLVDLNERQVDDDLRPFNEQKIVQVIIDENPFPELVPRVRETEEALQDSDNSDYDDPLARPKSDPSKAKKLSFYDDDDDDDDEEDADHGDEKPLKGPISDIEPAKSKITETEDLKQKETSKSPEVEEDKKSDVDSKEQRLKEIRAQIQMIKQQIEDESDVRPTSERRKRDDKCDISNASGESAFRSPDEDEGQIKLRIAGKKDRGRERETIELLQNFKKKLKEATAKVSTDSGRLGEDSDKRDRQYLDELDELDKLDGDDWLSHKFEAADELRSARDANTKDDDWYSLDDPRNKRFASSGRKHRSRDEHYHRSSDRRHKEGHRDRSSR